MPTKIVDNQAVFEQTFKGQGEKGVSLKFKLVVSQSGPVQVIIGWRTPSNEIKIVKALGEIISGQIVIKGDRSKLPEFIHNVVIRGLNGFLANKDHEFTKAVMNVMDFEGDYNGFKAYAAALPDASAPALAPEPAAPAPAPKAAPAPAPPPKASAPTPKAVSATYTENIARLLKILTDQHIQLGLRWNSKQLENENELARIIQETKNVKQGLLDTVGIRVDKLVDSDGHCGFSAVANALHDVGINGQAGKYKQQELRAMVADHVLENPGKFIDYLNPTEHPDEEDIATYAASIRENKYMDNIALRALSDIFNVNIGVVRVRFIFSSDEPMPKSVELVREANGFVPSTPVGVPETILLVFEPIADHYTGSVERIGQNSDDLACILANLATAGVIIPDSLLAVHTGVVSAPIGAGALASSAPAATGSEPQIAEPLGGISGSAAATTPPGGTDIDPLRAGLPERAGGVTSSTGDVPVLNVADQVDEILRTSVGIPIVHAICSAHQAVSRKIRDYIQSQVIEMLELAHNPASEHNIVERIFMLLHTSEKGGVDINDVLRICADKVNAKNLDLYLITKTYNELFTALDKKIEDVIRENREAVVGVNAESGANALHIFAGLSPSIVMALADIGVDPNLLDVLGSPPLFCAATVGSTQAFDALVARGARVDHVTKACPQKPSLTVLHAVAIDHKPEVNRDRSKLFKHIVDTYLEDLMPILLAEGYLISLKGVFRSDPTNLLPYLYSKMKEHLELQVTTMPAQAIQTLLAPIVPVNEAAAVPVEGSMGAASGSLVALDEEAHTVRKAAQLNLWERCMAISGREYTSLHLAAALRMVDLIPELIRYGYYTNAAIEHTFRGCTAEDMLKALLGFAESRNLATFAARTRESLDAIARAKAARQTKQGESPTEDQVIEAMLEIIHDAETVMPVEELVPILQGPRDPDDPSGDGAGPSGGRAPARLSGNTAASSGEAGGEGHSGGGGSSGGGATESIAPTETNEDSLPILRLHTDIPTCWMKDFRKLAEEFPNIAQSGPYLITKLQELANKLLDAASEIDTEAMLATVLGWGEDINNAVQSHGTHPHRGGPDPNNDPIPGGWDRDAKPNHNSGSLPGFNISKTMEVYTTLAGEANPVDDQPGGAPAA